MIAPDGNGVKPRSNLALPLSSGKGGRDAQNVPLRAGPPPPAGRSVGCRRLRRLGHERSPNRSVTVRSCRGTGPFTRGTLRGRPGPRRDGRGRDVSDHQGDHGQAYEGPELVDPADWPGVENGESALGDGPDSGKGIRPVWPPPWARTTRRRGTRRCGRS